MSISSSAAVTAEAAKSPPLQGRVEFEELEVEVEVEVEHCSLDRSLGKPASSLLAEIESAASARRAAAREGIDEAGAVAEAAWEKAEEEGEAAAAGGVEGAGGGDADGRGGAAAEFDESPSRSTQLLRSFFLGSAAGSSSSAALASPSTTVMRLLEATISEAGVARSARATARAAVAEEKPWRRETFWSSRRRRDFFF